MNENEGKKIIVFAHHQSVLNKIEDSIKAIKRIRIDGSTNPKVRFSRILIRKPPFESTIVWFEAIELSLTQLSPFHFAFKSLCLLSHQKRQEYVKQFQNDPRIRVALLSTTAAGVAITLTASSCVWFAELYWTPGLLIQAEDRCHRIGQKEDVNVNYFVANDTLDDGKR